MNNPKKQDIQIQHKYMKYLSVAMILLFCELFFFRNIVGSDALVGDRGDGRLTTLLTEHWINFLMGRERFSEIAMFYPAEGVFGYTDLFLGYGLIYSIFRLAGINMFISYKYTLAAVHAMGTASMCYLMDRKLKCSVCWSLFGTMAFCFSDSYARHLRHTQLNALSALPVLLILFLGFWDNYEKRKRRNVYAYAFIVWFVLLTYTSWYVACFTGIFCLVFIIIYFIRLKMQGIRVLPVINEKILSVWKDIIGYAIFMIILYIPFIKVYLPVLKSSSGYSYGECVQYMPEFADIINVTGQNFYAWPFIEKLELSGRGYSGEVTEGFSIILLCLFSALFITNSKKSTSRTDSDVFVREILNVAFISVIVSITLIIRLSSNGVSLWIIVYTLLPIVRSMRAIARFLLWLSFPMAVVTAYAADKYIKFRKRTTVTTVSCIAVIMIFISNINTVGVYSFWNYQDECSFITNVSEPPGDAETFYIIDTADTKDSEYIYQLDAFEIATLYSLKTINGYSGQFPMNWMGIWDVCSENYENNVLSWISSYGISNVYAYDRATNTWMPMEERFKLAIDDVFCPQDNKFSLSFGLEDRSQGSFAWTNRDFETKINNAQINDTGLVIKMKTEFSWYMTQNPGLNPYLHIFVDDMLVQTVTVTDEYMEFNIPMTGHDSDIYDIKVKTNCYFNPKDIGINSDTRNLSIAMYYIGN